MDGTVALHRSDQRSRVLAALEGATEGLSTAEIVAAAGLANSNAAAALLFRMGNDGDIVRLKRGHYCLPNVAGSYAPHDQR
jgi:hypothetical protein